MSFLALLESIFLEFYKIDVAKILYIQPNVKVVSWVANNTI